ncbi:MAG: FGGY family carbohydrate kinase, partial [Candidatus Bathyarchaeia archaeon]
MKSGGRFVLAVDQGTTGTRAMLFDDSGFPVRGGWAYMEHRQIYPRPGWVEHDPIEIWENTKAVFRAVIEGAGIDIHDLVGIGVTNQRETVVVWDVRSGLPLYNAIVWQCRRTSSLVDYLRANYMDLIVNRTGLIPDPYFSATKIWWLLDNIPDLRVKVEKGEAVFGTIDTWIIWNMTRGSRDCLTPDMGGAYITDYSN